MIKHAEFITISSNHSCKWSCFSRSIFQEVLLWYLVNEFEKQSLRLWKHTHVSSLCFKLTTGPSFQQVSDGLQLAGHIKDLNSWGQCLAFSREDSLIHLALLQTLSASFLLTNGANTVLRFHPCCPSLRFLINRSNLSGDQKMNSVQLWQKEDTTVKRISVTGEVCAIVGHASWQTFFPCMFLVHLVQFRPPCFWCGAQNCSYSV